MKNRKAIVKKRHGKVAELSNPKISSLSFLMSISKSQTNSLESMVDQQHLQVVKITSMKENWKQYHILTYLRLRCKKEIMRIRRICKGREGCKREERKEEDRLTGAFFAFYSHVKRMIGLLSCRKARHEELDQYHGNARSIKMIFF